jgi:hypothetical protein
MNNDRLKYRVWHNTIKEWYEKEVALCYDGCIWWFSNGEAMDDITQEVTIEQCTGLKDKNGKLIYEGDIVNYYAYGRWITKKIHWNGRWYQLGDADIILCDMEIEDFSIEIIGNIHENPELLEVTP